jgi:hypothetical protein
MLMQTNTYLRKWLRQAGCGCHKWISLGGGCEVALAAITEL